MTPEQLREWCRANLKVERPGDSLSPRITWFKSWYNPNDHLCTKLRVIEHMRGGWIIILSCGAPYAANEAAWSGVYIGDAASAAQLKALLICMEETGQAQ